MMDPLSLIVNITTLIGATIGSSQFLYHFLSSILDAPVEIQFQQFWMQALLTTLSELHALTLGQALDNMFQPGFRDRLKSCSDDLQILEKRLALNFSPKPSRRTWNRVKYAFRADHNIVAFTQRLQMYHASFAMELAVVQCRLGIENLSKLNELLSRLPPQMTSLVSAGPSTRHPTTLVTNGSDMLANKEEWFSLLPSVRSESYVQIASSLFDFMLSFGPAVRILPRGTDLSSRLSCGYGLYVQILPRGWCNRYLCGIKVAAMLCMNSSRRYSLQWSLDLPRVIPYDSEIFRFVRNSDMTAVKQMVTSKNCWKSDVAPDGSTLLHLACVSQNLDMVNLLLQEGVDPNASDIDGLTPLHLALMMGGNREISHALLRHGADIGNRDVEGKTPCHTFFNSVVGDILFSHRDEIRVILEPDQKGLNIFHYISWSSKSDAHHIFACISADDILSISSRDRLGRNMLHLASQRGNVTLIESLLQTPLKNDINLSDKNGLTALHYAVESKRIDAISVLETAGAKIHLVDSQGKTPMDHAREKQNILAINRLDEIISKSMTNGFRPGGSGQAQPDKSTTDHKPLNIHLCPRIVLCPALIAYIQALQRLFILTALIAMAVFFTCSSELEIPKYRREGD